MWRLYERPGFRKKKQGRIQKVKYMDVSFARGDELGSSDRCI